MIFLYAFCHNVDYRVSIRYSTVHSPSAPLSYVQILYNKVFTVDLMPFIAIKKVCAIHITAFQGLIA